MKKIKELQNSWIWFVIMVVLWMFAIFAAIAAIVLGALILNAEELSPQMYETIAQDQYGNPIVAQKVERQWNGIGREEIKQTARSADDTMREAWRRGREGQEQPVHVHVTSEGNVVTAQKAPVRIVTKPNGELGLSEERTTITVHPAPIVKEIVPGQTIIKIGNRRYQVPSDMPVELFEQLSILLAQDATAEVQIKIQDLFYQYEQNRAQTKLALISVLVKEFRTILLWGVVLCVPLTMLILRYVGKQKSLKLEQERIWSKELYPDGKKIASESGVHVHFHNRQMEDWDVEMQKENGEYRRYPKVKEC